MITSVTLLVTLVYSAQTIQLIHGYRSNFLFSVKGTLPALEASISAPSFSNGTSFSVPYSIETVAAPIPVTYTNRPSEVEQWLNDNVYYSNGNSITALGFDVESVPNTPWFKKKVAFEGPATVQLATPDNCLVVHLTRKFGQTTSPCVNALQGVLADPSILKVGAGIDQDFLELFRFNNNLRGASRFDLGSSLSSANGNNCVGLKALAKALLGIELKKSKRLAMSNWSKFPLGDQQIHYCARDAWTGAAVFQALQEIHPDTFDNHQIQNLLLQNERPVAELCERATQRKQAKNTLKTIIPQYKVCAGLPENTSNRDIILPPLVQREMDKLKAIMKDTVPEKTIVFDRDLLCITL